MNENFKISGFASLSRREGVTLMELLLSTLIGSIILMAAYRLLSSGIRHSTKGAAHLTNVQTTALLMSQIEDDLERTCDVGLMKAQESQASATVTIVEEATSGLSTAIIKYQKGIGNLGMMRIREKGAAIESHAFCRDLMLLDCSFTRLNLPDGGIGFQVFLKTGTPPKGTEVFEMTRFIYCRNHASNSVMIGWHGK